MASHIRLADHVRETRIVNERLVFAGIFSVLLFSVVIGRLAILQVMEYEHFDSLSAKNRVDINPLPPQRGLIYDRNGVLLAENIPTFSLELTPEKVSDLEQTLAGIAEIFELSDEEVDALKQHIKVQRRFKNIVIRQRLTDEEVAKFAVNRHKYNGVEVVGHLIRHYPHSNLFAHAIGYVGRINERDQQRIDAKNYKGTLQIGKTGVERFYEDSLHGTVGYKKVETNVQGRVVREIEREESISGSDLFLHFDINMQRLAAEALGEHNGAVVAMDPRDGGILALVSKPDFDPNDFVTGISSKKIFSASRFS
jgi:penicillin-binding protein 2